jgi:2-polyprenyl-3-methyl-5-hydroxy-6-metoxy-1,4-benzoquinol methylase
MTSRDPRQTAQQRSLGNSSSEIHRAALEHADPLPGLTWLDIGAGSGTVLREVRDRFPPIRMVAVDIIDWLNADLRQDVELITGPFEETLGLAERFDRVLLIETIEHLEAPWTALRAAAALVRPGGRLVVTTPNVATLRHGLELLARGTLTSFRPDNAPHLTPALPHVTGRIMREEGLLVDVSFAGRDVIPLSGGRLWHPKASCRWPQRLNVSVISVGRRGGA